MIQTRFHFRTSTMNSVNNRDAASISERRKYFTKSIFYLVVTYNLKLITLYDAVWMTYIVFFIYGGNDMRLLLRYFTYRSIWSNEKFWGCSLYKYDSADFFY